MDVSLIDNGESPQRRKRWKRWKNGRLADDMVLSPHLKRVTFSSLQAIQLVDLAGAETAKVWRNADDILYNLSTRWPWCRLLLVIKGKFDSTSPIENLVETMRNLLPRFMDIGTVETKVSTDIAWWPEHSI